MSPRVALWLAVGLAAAACTSPESTRLRSGGPGADPGNRTGVVRIHEGAEPYWKTPKRLADRVQAPAAVARQADRLSRGQHDPAASPPEKSK